MYFLPENSAEREPHRHSCSSRGQVLWTPQGGGSRAEAASCPHVVAHRTPRRSPWPNRGGVPPLLSRGCLCCPGRANLLPQVRAQPSARLARSTCTPPHVLGARPRWLPRAGREPTLPRRLRQGSARAAGHAARGPAAPRLQHGPAWCGRTFGMRAARHAEAPSVGQIWSAERPLSLLRWPGGQTRGQQGKWRL